MDFIQAFAEAVPVLQGMPEATHEELLAWVDQVSDNFAEVVAEHTNTVVAEYSEAVNLAVLAFAAGTVYQASLDEDEVIIEVPLTRDGVATYIEFLTERAERGERA